MRLTLANGKEHADLLRQANYTHEQTASSATWTITHNLGKYPSVTLVESTGVVVLGRITYTSVNQITVEFVTAITGKAFLN